MGLQALILLLVIHSTRRRMSLGRGLVRDLFLDYDNDLERGWFGFCYLMYWILEDWYGVRFVI
jgi:hypothetical protein